MQKLVCHITSVHKRDDIRIFVKQCRSLAKNGYAVALIVADSLGEGIVDGVKIFDVGKADSRFKRMYATPRQIYQKILELEPWVVHFHDPELMLIGVKLAKKGYQVIYDVHEDLPKQITAKYWIPRLIRKPLSHIALLLEKFCSKHYAGVITATPIIAKRFSKYNSRVKAICNYPILSEFVGVCNNWDSRDNTIGYIGSISETRGIIPLISSLQYSKVKLELAGSFSGNISEEILAKLGGYEYVNYLGILNREGIAELLSRIKIGIVTLLPTQSYVESLPIKLFEYMLAGIPVIASNFKLWQDIVKKHECGVLVNPNNPHEIATACLELLNNPELALRMGENGKNAVINYFNWDKEVGHLIDFYQNL